MKECPFCKEDNMSKSLYCCMCGKEFPKESAPVEEKPARRFVAFGGEAPAKQEQVAEQVPSKPASRFKPM